MPKSSHQAEYGVLLEALRRTRKGQGITQVQLANRLQRHQSFVSKYECGERRLDLVELREVCCALGISLEEFVSNFERNLR